MVIAVSVVGLSVEFLLKIRFKCDLCLFLWAIGDIGV